MASALQAPMILMLVPALTGAASALWAPIARLTLTGLSCLNAGVYVAVWLALLATRRDDPGLTEAARVLGLWPLVAYVALTAALSAAWFAAQVGTHVVWLAVAETAWPIYVLVTTLALAQWTSLPVYLPAISPLHGAGATLIMAGVVVIAIAERTA